MGVILKLEHIQKYYGSGGSVTRAIRDISFSVEKGEFLAIMGTSGSGKTTLLNCISTIDTVSAGHIYLEGVDVTEMKPKSLAGFRRENLGFVFQDFNLLDTLTISENIALALSINKVPAREVEPRILDIAGKLNITIRYREDRGSAVPARGRLWETRSCFWRMSLQEALTAIPPKCCLPPFKASTSSLAQRF